MPIRSSCTLLIVAMLSAGLPVPGQAQTQHDLHVQADSAYRRADSTLNVTYRRLLARYSADTLASRKLRAAQRAWLAFRDAQIEATFPATDKQAAYGTIYPMCVLLILKDLTETRLAQLRAALQPEDGEVCGGGPA